MQTAPVCQWRLSCHLPPWLLLLVVVVLLGGPWLHPLLHHQLLLPEL
jgi:hypothetical protein